MYYQVVSFSHKSCGIEEREKLAFSKEEEKKLILDQLTGFEFVHEAFIISTCNRVEIVLATKDNFSSFHAVLGLMSQKSSIGFYELKGIAKQHDDKDAIEHIFSVVSSLDSIVIGESQITGQVKDAFKFSYKNGTAGAKLNRVISYAIKCAAEVRNVTSISKNPISIASVAVSQAHSILGDDMQGMKAIVVGAGEMGVLAVKHLVRTGCDVVLIGRDIKKTELIAEELGKEVVADAAENLPELINRYRLLFSATSSKEPVIKKEFIENETLARLWFDIAIPRDIEEMNLEKLQLFRVDDLKSIADKNHALREEHAVKASEIVKNYKDDFYKWLETLSVEPIIKQIRLYAEDAIESELQRAMKKGFVDKEYEENMRKMANQMFKRFLHDPTQNLRRSSTQSKDTNCIEAVKKMFNIELDDKDVKKYKEDHHTKGYNA